MRGRVPRAPRPGASRLPAQPGEPARGLSSTRRMRRPDRCPARINSMGRSPCSRTSSTAPIAGRTSAGSRTDSSATNHAPSGKRSATRRAASRERRVLPVPPGPVRVTRRAPSINLARASISASRPTKVVSGSGRLPSWTAAVRSGGNPLRSPSAATWYRRSGRGRSFSRCSPRSISEMPVGIEASTIARVASETSTCPPWPAAAIRAARWTSMPT